MARASEDRVNVKRDAGQRAGDILREILVARGAGEGQLYNRLFSGWDELVGSPLAGRSAILELENNQLVVALDHPASLQLLRMQQRGILRQLKRRFPQLAIRAIRGIVLPAGMATAVITRESVDEDPILVEETIGTEGVDEETLRPALQELSAVSDERLRAALARLYREAIRRSRGSPDRSQKREPGR